MKPDIVPCILGEELGEAMAEALYIFGVEVGAFVAPEGSAIRGSVKQVQKLVRRR